MLNSLVEKGLVKKYEKFENGMKFCDYQFSGENLPQEGKKAGSEETSPGGDEKTSPGVKNLHQGGEEISPGGDEKTATHTSSIPINFNNSSSSGGEPPDTGPPGNEKEAEADISPKKIKKDLLAMDAGLVLTKDFYPKASEFMAARGLSADYLPWVYNQCKIRKPNSFNSYFYKLFFEENIFEAFKAVYKPPRETLPPPEVKCPVCGQTHGAHDKACPGCGLPDNAPPERVEFLKRLSASLPPDKQGEYLRKEEAVYAECGFDFKSAEEKISALNLEFGIGEIA